MSANLVPLLVADVFELAGEFRRHGEALAAGAGQTQARWQLLSAASVAPPRTVAQLARRLGVARQGVQRLADRLVADGAAAFHANLDHRGSPLLMLTAAGRRDLDRINAAAARFHQQLAARLSPAALRATHRGLRQTLGALRIDWRWARDRKTHESCPD